MLQLRILLTFFGLAVFTSEASAQSKIFGIGSGMTGDEVLSELQSRNWITEEEAVPIPIQSRTGGWVDERLKEFDAMNDSERVEYYNKIVRGSWRDPFLRKIFISNSNIELEMDQLGASIEFKCGEMFECADQISVLTELCSHLGQSDFLFESCDVDTLVRKNDVLFEIQDFDQTYTLSADSLSFKISSASFVYNIFTVYEALGFDLEQLRTRYGHSTEAHQAESKFD